MRRIWGEEHLDEGTRASMEAVLDAAFRVHRALGPGFFELVYRRCLAHALRKDGHVVDEEVYLPVQFEDLLLDRAYRADILVDGRVVVEVKAAEGPHPVHAAQLIAYLKASRYPAGAVVNFNVEYFRHGYDRFVHPDLLKGKPLAQTPDVDPHPRVRGFAE